MERGASEKVVDTPVPVLPQPAERAKRRRERRERRHQARERVRANASQVAGRDV
ncbi:hypothetical protein ACVWZR_000031 [Bradyrhizobium sp. i1.3.1]